jgi:hypothetical protein
VLGRRRVLKAASALTVGAAAGTLGFPAIVRSQQAKRFLKPIVAGLNAKEGDPTYNSIALVPKILREKYDVQVEFQIHPSSSLGTDLSQLDAADRVHRHHVEHQPAVLAVRQELRRDRPAVHLHRLGHVLSCRQVRRVEQAGRSFEARVPLKVLPPVGAGGFRMLSNNVRRLLRTGRGEGPRSAASPRRSTSRCSKPGAPTPRRCRGPRSTALQQGVVNGYHVHRSGPSSSSTTRCSKYATEVKAIFSIQFQVMNMNT